MNELKGMVKLRSNEEALDEEDVREGLESRVRAQKDQHMKRGSMMIRNTFFVDKRS